MFVRAGGFVTTRQIEVEAQISVTCYCFVKLEVAELTSETQRISSTYVVLNVKISVHGMTFPY
jgi:hypothetical protein